MKHFISLSILLLFTISAGCCHQPQAVSEVEPQPAKPRPVTCGSMPQIQDKSKLKASLLERGVINDKMTAAEADAKVDDYIRQRQKVFEKCLKGSEL